MATIYGNGAPAPVTEASIGDIYMDKSNKKVYKCTFAYKASNSVATCDWEETNEINFVQEQKHEAEPMQSADKTESRSSEQKRNYTPYGKKNNNK